MPETFMPGARYTASSRPDQSRRCTSGRGRSCASGAVRRRLFLKQEQPPQGFEVALTVALAECWPDRVPEVVAADIKRGWLLTRDDGIRVAYSRAFDAFPGALALYGELQVAEVAHVDDFLASLLKVLACA